MKLDPIYLYYVLRVNFCTVVHFLFCTLFRWGLRMCCKICHLCWICIWFYFLWFALSNMCYIKKTISVTVLVKWVINSFCTGLNSRVVPKALTCSYLALSDRVLTQTTREYDPVRRTFSVTLTIYTPLRTLMVFNTECLSIVSANTRFSLAWSESYDAALLKRVKWDKEVSMSESFSPASSVTEHITQKSIEVWL